MLPFFGKGEGVDSKGVEMAMRGSEGGTHNTGSSAEGSTTEETNERLALALACRSTACNRGGRGERSPQKVDDNDDDEEETGAERSACGREKEEEDTTVG